MVRTYVLRSKRDVGSAATHTITCHVTLWPAIEGGGGAPAGSCNMCECNARHTACPPIDWSHLCLPGWYVVMAARVGHAPPPEWVVVLTLCSAVCGTVGLSSPPHTHTHTHTRTRTRTPPPPPTAYHLPPTTYRLPPTTTTRTLGGCGGTNQTRLDRRATRQ